jgi:hypothetical protein
MSEVLDYFCETCGVRRDGCDVKWQVNTYKGEQPVCNYCNEVCEYDPEPEGATRVSSYTDAELRVRARQCGIKEADWQGSLSPRLCLIQLIVNASAKSGAKGI